MLGQTDGRSWAAARLPRLCPCLWQGEVSACLAFLAQAGLKHSWLPAETPAQAFAQGTGALCSLRHREERWGRKGSQAGGRYWGTTIAPGRSGLLHSCLPTQPGCPKLPLRHHKPLNSGRIFLAPPSTLPCSLPFTAPERQLLEMNPTGAERGRLCQTQGPSA